MALNHNGSSPCTPKLLKTGLGLLAVCLLGYLMGPPLYWHFREGLAAFGQSSTSSSSAVSCPPCKCDCSAQSLPSIPKGLCKNLWYFFSFLQICLDLFIEVLFCVFGHLGMLILAF